MKISENKHKKITTLQYHEQKDKIFKQELSN